MVWEPRTNGRSGGQESHAVVLELRIASGEGELLLDGLRDEQPIEGIPLNPRHFAHTQGTVEIETKWVEPACAQGLGYPLRGGVRYPESAERSLDCDLPRKHGAYVDFAQNWPSRRRYSLASYALNAAAGWPARAMTTRSPFSAVSSSFESSLLGPWASWILSASQCGEGRLPAVRYVHPMRDSWPIREGEEAAAQAVWCSRRRVGARGGSFARQSDDLRRSGSRAKKSAIISCCWGGVPHDRLGAGRIERISGD